MGCSGRCLCTFGSINGIVGNSFDTTDILERPDLTIELSHSPFRFEN